MAAAVTSRKAPYRYSIVESKSQFVGRCTKTHEQMGSMGWVSGRMHSPTLPVRHPLRTFTSEIPHRLSRQRSQELATTARHSSRLAGLCRRSSRIYRGERSGNGDGLFGRCHAPGSNLVFTRGRLCLGRVCLFRRIKQRSLVWSGICSSAFQPYSSMNKFGLHVGFFPEEDPSEKELLMNFRFNCITQINPCLRGDEILPEGWRLFRKNKRTQSSIE
jgi:hypothetical protein